MCKYTNYPIDVKGDILEYCNIPQEFDFYAWN